MMGDFSGRANRGVMERGESLAACPLSAVDIDNFETLIERYRPSLQLPLGASTQSVEFTELDDFHPDALYQRLELFKSLRSLRSRLANPATFPQAAAELKFDTVSAEEPTDSEPTASQQQENDDNMFQRLLGKAPSEPEVVTAVQAAGVDKFIRDIVAPHVVRQDTQQQEAYISSVDDAISSQMRGLLHEPAFQALESAWRSLHRLVSGLETGEELKLYLLDVSKEELAADVAGAGGNLENSGLYRLLVEQGIRILGGEPWSLLVGDYRFGPDKEETTLLAALGAIASHAGGPFLAAASPAILGCSSLVESPAADNWQGLEREVEQSWQALRGSSVAPWLGLALPRVLLRLPYGRQGDEIDSFRFEEIAGASSPDHDSLLWGSPAYACAMLLGITFQERGWAMEPGDLQDIEDLPAYTFDDDGERLLMPCAETLLSERTGEAILGQGLIPLLSYRNRNTVRVLRFQSIASSGAALSGPWG